MKFLQYLKKKSTGIPLGIHAEISLRIPPEILLTVLDGFLQNKKIDRKFFSRNND